MNLCFLIGGFTRVGGIGRVTSILASELARDDAYHVHVLSYSDTQLPNLYILPSNVTQSHLLDRHMTAKKAIFHNAIGKLRKYIKDHSIDILIAGGALFFPFVVLATAGLKTKTIAWEHSNVFNKSDHQFQGLARLFGAKYSDCIVTLTKNDCNNYKNVFRPDRVEHIYNPVDNLLLERKTSYNVHSRRIISVGRLSYQKNFENLIDVARGVMSKNPDWSWDIYGEGEERESLAAKITHYGLQNHVFLKGRTDRIYDIYNDYAFLVMTSRYEGFPMTLLEGMSQGLPLLSYDVMTGPNEIISDGVNGYLVKPDDTETMISRINHLITNTDLRLEMSRNCINGVKAFSLDTIAASWKLLFGELSRT